MCNHLISCPSNGEAKGGEATSDSVKDFNADSRKTEGTEDSGPE